MPSCHTGRETLSCPTSCDKCLLVAAICFENREHYGVLSTIIINDKASHNSLDDRAGNRNACDRNGEQAGWGAGDRPRPGGPSSVESEGFLELRHSGVESVRMGFWDEGRIGQGDVVPSVGLLPPLSKGEPVSDMRHRHISCARKPSVRSGLFEAGSWFMKVKAKGVGWVAPAQIYALWNFLLPRHRRAWLQVARVVKHWRTQEQVSQSPHSPHCPSSRLSLF